MFKKLKAGFKRFVQEWVAMVHGIYSLPPIHSQPEQIGMALANAGVNRNDSSTRLGTYGVGSVLGPSAGMGQQIISSAVRPIFSPALDGPPRIHLPFSMTSHRIKNTSNERRPVYDAEGRLACELKPGEAITAYYQLVIETGLE